MRLSKSRSSGSTVSKLLLYVLLGTATVYGPYDGSPLFCDRDGSMIYGEVEGPWVAIDKSLYESGWARCGDLLRIEGDGWELEGRALDAGYLLDYQVEDWPGPIVVDIPIHLAPFELTWGPYTSAPARVINLTAGLRLDLQCLR